MSIKKQLYSQRSNMILALFFNTYLCADPYVKEKKYIEDATNTYRQLYGLNPLKRDKELDIAAQGHAARMAQKNFFDHTDPFDNSGPPERISRTKFPSTFPCENIFTCSERSDMGEAAISGWQVSDGHNANLKRQGLNAQGIGCAMAPKAQNGFIMWYACHVFDDDNTSSEDDLARKALIPLKIPELVTHLRKEYHVMAVNDLKEAIDSYQGYTYDENLVKIAKAQIDGIKSGKLKESEIEKNVAAGRKEKMMVIFQKFKTYQPPKRVLVKELSEENKKKLDLIDKDGVGVAIDLAESGTFYFCLVAFSLQ